jgi:L-fuconate dehydratase
VCIAGNLSGRVAEYVDHLHEHFEDPCAVKDGAYVLPSRPGYSITMKRESLARFSFPDGPVWSERIRTKGHA